MNRRIRFLAALLSLVALTLSIGESIWASVCPPGIGMEAVALDTAHNDLRANVHHGSAPASGDSDRSDSDVPACPWGMTGVGSSCVSVSLLAVAVTLVPTDVVSDLALRPGDVNNDRLLITLHFRPPRA
jgi:hypothetical protein